MDQGLPARLQGAFAHRQPRIRAEWDAQPAAVLVPLYDEGGQWHILFTLRTETVDVHRGQVSFPGGRMETPDETPDQAALREAQEEIGIRPDDVRLLGRLDPLLTVTQFRVEPVVGTIDWPYPLVLNRQEVALAFGVPIAWLLEPDHLELREMDLPGTGRPVPVYFFKPYRDQVIWGATARITLSLLELLRNTP